MSQRSHLPGVYEEEATSSQVRRSGIGLQSDDGRELGQFRIGRKSDADTEKVCNPLAKDLRKLYRQVASDRNRFHESGGSNEVFDLDDRHIIKRCNVIFFTLPGGLTAL
jgi:hypothetical protein